MNDNYIYRLLQGPQTKLVKDELDFHFSGGHYVIAIDFDGTLCRNCWPEIGEPNRRIINASKTAKAHGAKLILYTCREKKLLCEAVAWCAKRGLKFDAVNANLQQRIDQYGGDCRKISADEYWDDKATYIGGMTQ